MGTMGSIKKIGELLNDWLDDYLPNVLGRSNNTIKSYKSSWSSMITFLFTEKGIEADHISFDMLTFETIMEFLDWIKKSKNDKDSTRNSRRAAIVKFAEYAQNYDFDAAYKFYNAVQKVPGKRNTDAREREAMSKEQTRIMLDLPDIKDKYGRRDLTILNFLYASGCRSQELCDLKVSDVTIQESGKASIHLHGKGNKDRRIRISKTYADLLIKHMKQTHVINQPKAYVFTSQRNPKMSIAAVERIVNKYFERAKKNYPELFDNIVITPHVFRHTTATHMLAAGVPIMVVSRFLGHSDIKTTLVYAKLSEKDVNEKLKNWSEQYWGEYMDEPYEYDESGLTPEERNLAKIFGQKK